MKYSVKKSMIIALLVTASSSIRSAQDSCEAMISGHVVDIETKYALPGVTIYLSSDQLKSTITDRAGKFTLKSVCESEAYLIAKSLGYQTDTISLDFRKGKNLHIEFKLKESNKVLDEVTVTSERDAISQNQAATKLTSKDIQKSAGKPIGEILKQATGVSALQTGPTIFKPVIHGLHSQRIQIINNGVRLEGQQWGAEHGPEIDPYIASEITVVKGADVVKYGADAIGGAIIINPPSIHDADEFGGEVYMLGSSNGRLGAFSGMLEGRLLKEHHWKWRVQGTVKRGGDYSTPDYNLTNTGLKEINFSAAAGYRDATKALELFVSSYNTELGILRTAHTGSKDDLQQRIENHQDGKKPEIAEDFSYDINSPRQEVNHHMTELRAFQELSGVGRLNLTYSLQLNRRKEFDIRRSSTRPSLDLNLMANAVDLNLEHRKICGVSGITGLTAQIKNNDNVAGTGVTPLIPNYDQQNYGVFISEKYVKEKWGVELGVRLDHQILSVATFDNRQLVKPEYDFTYFSMAAGFHYIFSPNLTFSTHYGLGKRPPHVSELLSQGLHHGTASIEYGLLRPGGVLATDFSNEIIEMERSDKIMGNIIYQTEKTSVQTTGYVNNIGNYVFLKPTGIQQTIRGAFVTYSYDQSDVRMSGLDFSVLHDFHESVSYSGKLSLIRAKGITNNDVVINIPSNRFENEVRYNFEGGKVTEPFLAISMVNVLKQNRNPTIIAIEQIENQSSFDQVFDFVDSPDSYMLLNIETGFSIPIRENRLDFNLSVENVLNVNYNDYMNRLRYFVSEVGRNFSIRLKYNFHGHE